MGGKPTGSGKTDIVAADPTVALARYVPDLENWPASWRYEDKDLPFGQAVVGVFTPFLQHLLTKGYARKTLNRHRDHLWMLGGQLIERRHIYVDDAKLDALALILDQIDELGGPLISKHLSESEQNAFDSTCRKLHSFLSDRSTS